MSIWKRVLRECYIQRASLSLSLPHSRCIPPLHTSLASTKLVAHLSSLPQAYHKLSLVSSPKLWIAEGSKVFWCIQDGGCLAD